MVCVYSCKIESFFSSGKNWWHILSACKSTLVNEEQDQVPLSNKTKWALSLSLLLYWATKAFSSQYWYGQQSDTNWSEFFSWSRIQGTSQKIWIYWNVLFLRFLFIRLLLSLCINSTFCIFYILYIFYIG